MKKDPIAKPDPKQVVEDNKQNNINLTKADEHFKKALKGKKWHM